MLKNMDKENNQCSHDWQLGTNGYICNKCGVWKGEGVRVINDQGIGTTRLYQPPEEPKIPNWEVEFHKLMGMPYSPTTQRIENEILYFIRQLLISQKSQLYSVSEWKRVGKERDYWKYFEEEIKSQFVKEIEEMKEKGAKDKELILQERAYNKALDDIINLLKT